MSESEETTLNLQVSTEPQSEEEEEEEVALSSAVAEVSERPKRERKQVEAYANLTFAPKKTFEVPEGTGSAIGELPGICENLSKHKDEEDIIRSLHTLMFSAVGLKGGRKKNIRLFCGIPASDRAALETKIVDNKKKWNVALLKEAFDIFGLPHTGPREAMCARLADFLQSPHETSAGKEAPSAKKRKSAPASKSSKKKGKKSVDPNKPKRATTAFMLFSIANRPAVKAANPTLAFGDFGKIIGQMWHGLSEKDKNLWKDKAESDKAAAAGVVAAATANGSDGEEESDGKEDEEN